MAADIATPRPGEKIGKKLQTPTQEE